MEGHGEAVAERLEIRSVCLVMDISHTYMQGLDGEVGDVDFGTTGEELQQAERVFATRQTDEDFVVLVDELVLSQRFIECLPKSFVERHLISSNSITTRQSPSKLGFALAALLFVHKYQINGTDDEKECQDVVPV